MQAAAPCRNAASPGRGHRPQPRAPQSLPSPGCQKSLCRERRNRSAFPANVPTSAKPSAAARSPKSGVLQKSTRQTPANHLSSSPRLAERGTDRTRLPPSAAEAPRGSATGNPKGSQGGKKKLISREKGAVIAKIKVCRDPSWAARFPDLKQDYQSVLKQCQSQQLGGGAGCPQPRCPSCALPKPCSPWSCSGSAGRARRSCKGLPASQKYPGNQRASGKGAESKCHCLMGFG